MQDKLGEAISTCWSNRPPPPTRLPLQTAAMQDELGEACATVMVSWEEGEQGGSVHFEAFQCSEQCVRYRGGGRGVGGRDSGC